MAHGLHAEKPCLDLRKRPAVLTSDEGMEATKQASQMAMIPNLEASIKNVQIYKGIID